MDLAAPSQRPSQKIPGNIEDFLKEYPDLLGKLSPGSKDAFINICSSIAHLRSRKSRNFFITTFHHIEAWQRHPFGEEILRCAQVLSARNWGFIDPYFRAVKTIDQKAFVAPWSDFTLRLAERDIDVAITFLTETPRALAVFGRDKIFAWAERALLALSAGSKMGKAARAYLEEALADNCATPPARWEFFLSQAALIAAVSPAAAEAFIRQGSRVCLLLNNEETALWVQEGLASCRLEAELINYFNGTSLKALEKRDGIASGVALKDRSNILALICEAFLGHPARIRSNVSLLGFKGFSGGAATDGHTIYLPDVAPDFALLKLMALHQSVLLANEEWQYESEKVSSNPTQIHLAADKALLKKLPSLLQEMQRYMETEHALSYPFGLREEFPRHMPWWGDILPHLVHETSETIRQIQEKASDHDRDLPPEVLEALLASMMAEGEREVDGLWARILEMLSSVELTSPDPEELEESVKTFFYKEWDEELSDYKMNWTLVRQRLTKDDPNPFVADISTRLHGIITLIRRQFTRLKPERFKRYRAQPTGDDLDIDALVQAVVDMRSHSFLSENVYIRRDKRIRDVAVLFLVDMSGSTEELVNGRRVIDIEKEAMALMAEALDSLGDAFAIFGFSSEGRFRVDLFTVKEFGEEYGERAQYRLGNLEPRELTRLGAVIRHGIYKLDNTPALIKLMVILTDGRPYDLDYGSMDYALADTRKALQEARKQRIHPFIITSDKKGASYLRRISPQTQSIILPNVELLPAMLPNLYKRFTV
jgi:Mg-chelatase subunit ChlD